MFDALDPDTISEYTSDIIAQMMETVRLQSRVVLHARQSAYKACLI